MKPLKIIVVLCFALASCKHDTAIIDAQPARVLLFTKTAGYNHQSIAAGISMFQAKQADWHIAVTETADSKNFSTENLAKYQLIVLLNTTGSLFTDDQRAALQSFIRSGKALLGIHACTDAEYNWPWYGQMIGGWFDNHPATQQAKCDIQMPAHASVKGISSPWTRTDEWYNFKSLQPDNQVVVTIDESSYTGGGHGSFHPIVWYRHFEGGKIFYTSMGHTPETYSEPLYIKHIGGAIEWLLAK